MWWSDAEFFFIDCKGNPAPAVGVLHCHAALPMPNVSTPNPIQTKEICIPANGGAGERCILGSILWFEKDSDDGEESAENRGGISCEGTERTSSVDTPQNTIRLMECTATLPVPAVGMVDTTRPLTFGVCNEPEGRQGSAVAAKVSCYRVSISWRAVEQDVVVQKEESFTAQKGGEPTEGSSDSIEDAEEVGDEHVCTEEGTCSGSIKVDPEPEPVPETATSTNNNQDEPISLPVKLCKDDINADQSTIVIGKQAYSKPYAQYGRLISPTLSRIKRELSLGEQIAGADEDGGGYERFEHVVAMADLCSELAMSHSQNVMDAHEGRYMKRPLPEEHARGVAAYMAALELYQIASSIVEHENDLDAGGDIGVVGLLAAGASVTVHLADMVLADPAINQLDDDEDDEDDGVDLSPYYAKALRFTRQAIPLYEHAIDVLKEMERRSDDTMNGSSSGAARGQQGDDRVTVELGLADASLRLGNLIISSYEQGMFDIVLATAIEDAVDERTISLDTIDDQDASSSSEATAFGVDEERVLKEARENYQRAVAGYRRHAPSSEDPSEDRLLLADSLHANAIVSLYLSDLPNSIKMWEESLEIFLDVESQGIVSEKDIGVIIGENLQSLSDALLQSGRYDESADRYRESMHKYAEYSTGASEQIQVLSRFKFSPYESDDAIQINKDALEQYYQSIAGDPEVPIDYEYYPTSQVDELYEADLHATLGTLYLSRQETRDALQHLSRAIQLYEEYSEGDNDDLALADAYLNKAYALFYLGDYDMSIQAHKEAVEIYKTASPHGKPFTLRQGSGTTSVGGDESVDGASIRQRLINVDELWSGVQNMTHDRIN